MAHLLEPDYWVGFGQGERAEMRFLYPAARTYPQAIARLWQVSYGETGASEPTQTPRFPWLAVVEDPIPRLLQGMERSLSAGRLDDAREYASGVIGARLDAPPSLSPVNTDPLWTAVDVYDLAPAAKDASSDALREYFVEHRSVTSPKAPALLRCATQPNALAACGVGLPGRQAKQLYLDTRTLIPNGWASSVQGVFHDSGADQILLDRADAWLLRYPQHPLADWVRLWKVRIYYFSGANQASWRLLLDLYPRRRVRVLAEMRYLLLQGRWPSPAIVDSIQIPEVATGLAGKTVLKGRPELWDRWWRWAEQHFTEPWAINMQERLLAFLTTPDAPNTLPAAFPCVPARRSPLWTTLRAGLLLQHGQTDAGLAQLSLGPVDPDQAGLRAHILLQNNQPQQALRTPRLDEMSQAYLVRVRLDETELRNALGWAGPALARTVRIELATRQLSFARFDRAAIEVAPVDQQRASLLREADRLYRAQDPLRLARWLVAHAGQLSHGLDRSMVRSLSYYYVPGTPSGTLLEAALTRSDERWLSLPYYLRWLESHQYDPEARTVLKDADDTYNRVLNYGSFADTFWFRYAPETDVARRLRAVGREIRRGLR